MLASVRSRAFLRILPAALAFCGGGMATRAGEPPRAPVHPRRNVEEFAPAEAKYVRFSFDNTTRGEACLDELEIYGPDDPGKNLALADAGAIVSASGTLRDYRIHALRHLNDGLYGNGHSWIGDSSRGWVSVELPRPARINRIVWSRDRLGKFIDRLVTDYRIETALEPGQWRPAISSADRRKLELSGLPFPGFRSGSESLAASGETAVPSGPASREYVLETWHSSQGLPANSVTAILQTRDRWLWIGTAGGLARFDGVQFLTSGAEALKGLRVTCLLETPDGLRAGTDGGGLFRQVHGRFEPVSAADLPERSIHTLAADAAGTVWTGTPGGLYFLRDGHFVRHSAGPVTRLTRDRSGSGLWLLRAFTLAHCQDGVISPPLPDEEPSRFSSLAAMACDAGGTVWFGGANEYVASLAGDRVTTFADGHSLFTTTLQAILPTAGGDVWLGMAGSGLARLRDGQILTFGPDDGLPSNTIAAIGEDTEGNIWAGGGDGLTRISPRRCGAVTLNDGLSHSVVTSAAEDLAGNVWLGTAGGGICRWNGDRAEPFTPSYVLDNEQVPALLAGRDGGLRAATQHSGLAFIDGDSIRFVTTREGLPENAVTAICEDAEGGIWTGGPSAGPAYVRDGLVVIPPAVQPLRGERITAIATDASGRVWFGTAGQGLVLLEHDRLQWISTADGLAGNSVRTLLTDADGTLWAGTSAGLARWHNGRLDAFTARHGLPDETISGIVRDGNDHLWLGTNRGVVRVSLASLDDVREGRSSRLDFRWIDRGDGLPAAECTPGAIRLRDGRLCFGTVGGLAVIDPARFAAPPEAPPVVVEPDTDAVQTAGHAVFRFAALAYSAPQRLRFRYRLEGLDAGWTEAGPQRTASYDFLPPGSFRFAVQASLDGGPWGSAEVAFRVPAPWWRTPWAMGGGAAAAAVLIAAAARFISRRRLQRRLHEVEQKLALERERTRIARDIHDQLGANLTHIALLSAGAHDSHPPAVRERFLAIAASSNELVQAVDAIVWAVNPRHGSLESLARYLTRFADEFLGAAGIRLRPDVPVNLPAADLSPELRHSLFLAAREALNNCVRHAAATEVHLTIRVDAPRLTITITDNGRGFVPAESPDGDGLGNLSRRLAECGGRCDMLSALGRGTTVAFSIPLAVRS